jgi:uncharacterized protein
MMSEVLEQESELRADGTFRDISENEEQRPQGPITRPDGKIIIGRVGAPPQQEATSDQFFFTVPPLSLVEKTQLVTTESEIDGRIYKFYAIVTEVRRQSRKSSMGSEADEYDGDLSYHSSFKSAGFTYACATILRTEPPVLIPPREQSDVLLAGPEEALKAYDADDLENPMAVGLIKNGGDQLVGNGLIDLDYLLGTNGGHMNVNGAAGRGTKSSFLLFVIYMLLHLAQRLKETSPSDTNRLRVVPIILNVKTFDLFHIDSPSTRYRPEKHAKDWQALGIQTPEPFKNVTYYAAQTKGGIAIPTSRKGGVKPFSWGFADIIENGLFRYLFAETDANDANFGGLVMDLESLFTNEKVENDGKVTRSLNLVEKVTTFEELIGWVQGMTMSNDPMKVRGHHQQTWRKFFRRLRKVVYEGGGVLRLEDQKGSPLRVARADTTDPIVIDLSYFAGRPELQRFVVATILHQLVDARTGTNAQKGLRYIVMLDELNRFAPRGATDSITRLVELVASEMRSQGIILLGAQQQASKVSEKIIENAGILVLGKTGAVELQAKVWHGLSTSARRKAESLPPNEKLIMQDNFREPMHVRVPFPVWAMNPTEAKGVTKSSTKENNNTEEKLSDLIDH